MQGTEDMIVNERDKIPVKWKMTFLQQRRWYWSRDLSNEKKEP